MALAWPRWRLWIRDEGRVGPRGHRRPQGAAPRNQPPVQILDGLGLGGCKVSLLAGILLEVEELELAGLEVLQELPAAQPKGPSGAGAPRISSVASALQVAREVPEERALFQSSPPGQVAPAQAGGKAHPGEGQEGGSEIHMVRRLRARLTLERERAPVQDEGHADAPLTEHSLPAAEGLHRGDWGQAPVVAGQDRHQGAPATQAPVCRQGPPKLPVEACKHARVPGVALSVIGEPLAEGRNLTLRRLDRGVDRVGRPAEEEGPVLLGAEHLGRGLPLKLREPAALGRVLGSGQAVGRLVALGRVPPLAAGEVALEAEGRRVLAEVPLAHMNRVVARLPQSLRNGPAALLQGGAGVGH
jgi:hypothetical protein